MIKKDTLHEIENLAKFIFEEKDYNLFMKKIEEGKYNLARLILENIITELEITECSESDNTETLQQLEQATRLEDVVMNLLIENEDVNDEGKQSREIITK